MNSLPDPLIGVVLNDRYRIGAKIARGGMAMVYRGTDLRLDREIAIKVMHEHLISDDTFVERFRREAINAGRLTHPNLVAIHDQARDGDVVYLVMEHLPSVTLRRELKHRGTFTPRQAIVVLDAILAALEAVHSTGIIHRDLKPDNVLLGTDGQVKLADFGLARAVTSATTTKTLIGTVGYVAPELVTRAGADARTDLYTVGIMFYEMLTGSQPYTDDVPIQVAYRHVHDTVPPPSERTDGISPLLDALVLWATSKDPEDRPEDAGEFRRALAEARAQMSDAELDYGDPDAVAGEHSPALTASIDLGEEVPKERKSRTDEIPYLAEEDADGEGTAAADDAANAAANGDEDSASVPLAGTAAAVAAGGTAAAIATGPGAERAEDTDDPQDASDDDAAADGATASAGDVDTADDATASEDAADTGKDGKSTRAGKRTRTKAAAMSAAAAAGSGSGGSGSAGSGSGGSGTGGGSRGAGDDDPAPVAAGAAHTRRRRRRRLATTVGAGLVVLVLLAWLIIANLPAPTSIVPGQLAGKEFSEATEVVESSGLNPEKQEVFDDSIPAGTVIGSEPVGGTELSPDSTVTLVVSKGVETFAVPELEGLSAEKAKAALDDAGLGVGKVDEKYDENVAKGIVISASEKEGEELVHDAKVDLVVSKGDAPVEVPDVEGLTYDAAFATLTKRGFRVGKEEVFSDTVPKGKVVFQWPKSTEAKPYNSLVIVRVSKGKEEKKDDKPKDEKPKDEKKDEGK
ncbi:PASTA domain-containing protein [Brevibacterium casei]|uniref:non-specific serine/threonine protein kinase n=4 Tax=Brevibacterium casei TaxID=33889 RepID=K9AIQ5_9MICO|nr:PASTA domain-containing protein [Brevibacterium casei]EKU45926.1 serine/threonine protein kinase [Brevibacterium casei S18]KZE11819.1 serine/threonine protein kinase [Brevibacterium casei]MBE4695874.1 PASTA domain-containing protein [Brevibacterium casei]MBY3578996.1 PASTA domain-containing protein [Brevibacterium casei]MCT1447594.1 PASTA domain-containing protein [Brevibacterium casei]